MAKKLTHSDIEPSFKNEGYTLLSKYEGAFKNISCKCPVGHDWQISWIRWNQGCRCAECKRDQQYLCRLSLQKDSLAKDLEDEGYKFISITSGNTNTAKLRCFCPQGHEWETILSSWRRGYRCCYCSKPNKRYESEEVVKALSMEGYTVLGEYKNSHTKVECLCPEGHKHNVVWSEWNNKGRRCRICSVRKRVDRIRTTESVRIELKAEGYVLQSEYISTNRKIKCLCPNNHEYEFTFANWSKGKRCAECLFDSKRLNHDEVKHRFESEGYTLISVYHNARTKLKCICPFGHDWSVTGEGWQKGRRCPICAGFYPNEHRKKINKLSCQLASQVRESLKQVKASRTFSKMGFARSIANEILLVLGDRPEGYHLDHIIPRCFFDITIEQERIACWNIENLRWLPASENCRKGRRLSDADFYKLTENQKKLLQIASMKPERIVKLLEAEL